MDRLLYATPTGGHPHPRYVTCMRAMDMGIRSFGARAVEDFNFTRGPVQAARSAIVNHAMRGRCFVEHDHSADGGSGCRAKAYDYVLQHDDDLHVDPHIAIEVEPGKKAYINPVDEWHAFMDARPDVGVVGAVYLRENPFLPTVTIAHPDAEGEVCQVVHGLPFGMVEVAGVATGFMLVRREVFEALGHEDLELGGQMPAFRFNPFRRLSASGMCAEEGEDYDFCRRVRAAGFKVYVDTRFPTIHCKDSGLLRYSQPEWEAAWNDRDADGKPSEGVRQMVQDIEKVSAPGIKPFEVSRGGCSIVALDHLEVRAREVAEWNEKLKIKREQAAAIHTKAA